MIKRITGLLLALLMLVFATGVIAGAAPRSHEPTEPTETPEPTEAPEPTDTPEPTNTPAPADTPEPTDTPKPADPLEITTSSLPAGKVGKSYQFQLEANYGDATFRIGSGDLGKFGLSLSKDGVISGTPKKAGTCVFVVVASSASAGSSVRKEFSLKIDEADPTPTPTAAVSEPISTPTATPGTTSGAETTPAPTQPPATVAPVNPTATSSSTMPPAQTAQPTPAPTRPGTYIAYPLWQRAAETVLQVGVGQAFDIKLIEGISQNLTFSNFYGNLPDSVEFVNEISSKRSCSVKGTLRSEGASEFAVEFTIRGGRKLMLNFRLTASGAEVRPVVGFPQGRYLVPFGGTQNVCLPIDDERRRAV